MKKFIKNNEGFICINCGRFVKAHKTSSRDHCTYCLRGLHVDINPGDRKNECRGILEPIGIKESNGKTQIVYTCLKCNKSVFCIKAPDDDFDQVLKLSTKVWKLNIL